MTHKKGSSYAKGRKNTRTTKGKKVKIIASSKKPQVIDKTNPFKNLKNRWIEEQVYENKKDTFNVKLFYVPVDEIVGSRDGKWEHSNIYDVDDPIGYYETFTPVAVEKIDGKWEFYDGFHRVNFCLKYNLPVPCVKITDKKNTHQHETFMGSYTLQYLVHDKNCKNDLEKDTRNRCRKR